MGAAIRSPVYFHSAGWKPRRGNTSLRAVELSQACAGGKAHEEPAMQARRTFLRAQVNCERVPLLPAAAVREILDDLRKIPISWSGKGGIGNSKKLFA